MSSTKPSTPTRKTSGSTACRPGRSSTIPNSSSPVRNVRTSPNSQPRLARYGAGRTRQAIASCAIGPKNAPGILAIVGTLFFLKKPKTALATGLGLFGVLAGVLAATSPNKNKDLRVGLAGALAVACYAIGQVIGLLPPRRRSRDVTVWKLEVGAPQSSKNSARTLASPRQTHPRYPRAVA